MGVTEIPVAVAEDLVRLRAENARLLKMLELSPRQAAPPGPAQAGFFDAEDRLRSLSAAGDPLERLKAVVDFELFRAELEAALRRGDRSRGGRPRMMRC